MNEFYVLQPVDGYFGTKWAYAETADPINLGPSDKCPVCARPVSLRQWLPPYRVKLSSSKPTKWGDFIWVGGTSLAVSIRVKVAYEKSGLSGIDSFTPVEFVKYGKNKSGNFPVIPPSYFIIRVPWGGAKQDDDASDVLRRHPHDITCQYCQQDSTSVRQGRIIIDVDSWHGDDIFRPRGAPVQYMVSQKFKDMVDACQFTNVWLIPGTKYGYDEKRWGLWYVLD